MCVWRKFHDLSGPQWPHQPASDSHVHPQISVIRFEKLLHMANGANVRGFTNARKDLHVSFPVDPSSGVPSVPAKAPSVMFP